MATVTVRFDREGGGHYTFQPPFIFIKDPIKKEVAYISIPRADGEIEQDSGKRGRELKVEGVIRGTNWDDVQTKMRAMESGLGTDLGVLHIISDTHDFYFKTRPISIEFRDSAQATEAPFIVQFKCSDPQEYQVY